MEGPPITLHTEPHAAKPAAARDARGLLKGIALTAVLAVFAGKVAELPGFSVMGVMIVSIMAGVLWRTFMDVPSGAAVGVAFSSKFLLRAGIVLMGLRLNLRQIADAGLPVLIIDAAVIAFALSFVLWLGAKCKVDKELAVLIAVGTAVCGAAAIAAVAPLIGARKETTAVSVACIAVMGTIGAVLYIVLFPAIGPDPLLYGVFAGSTLHELAHVIAAGAAGGDAAGDMAVVVKLGRVALLIPAALLLGWLYRDKTPRGETAGRRRIKDLPIPWFIFGFLAMSVVNSLHALPETAVAAFVAASTFLMSAAMAGLGLGMKLGDFRRLGGNAVFVAVAGYAALAAVGLLLVKALY